MTDGTFTVPASIDAGCSKGVSTALNSWIQGVPDGSTLIFPSGSCYLLDGDAGIDLSLRSNLVLEGTGARITAATDGTSNRSSTFFIDHGHDIVIRGFSIDGGNESTGTPMPDEVETRNAAAVRAGSFNIEFDHVTWDRTFGFGVWLGSDETHDVGDGAPWPHDIWVHDCSLRGGEQGLAITAARSVLFERSTVTDVSRSAFDLEPDASQSGGGGFENVTIRDNTIDGYGWYSAESNWLLASVPDDAVVGTATMRGLTFSGNTVIRGVATGDNGNFDGLGGLGIRADKANPKVDYVIADNTTSIPNTGPSSVMWFANVDNLFVTGNHQPIANGAALVRDSGTSGERIVDGNDTGS